MSRRLNGTNPQEVVFNNIEPALDNTYNLGSATNAWSTVCTEGVKTATISTLSPATQIAVTNNAVFSGSILPAVNGTQLIGAGSSRWDTFFDTTNTNTLFCTTATLTNANLNGLVNAVDDAAAAIAGVPVQRLYRNGNELRIRIV